MKITLQFLFYTLKNLWETLYVHSNTLNSAKMFGERNINRQQASYSLNS